MTEVRVHVAEVWARLVQFKGQTKTRVVTSVGSGSIQVEAKARARRFWFVFVLPDCRDKIVHNLVIGCNIVASS